MVTLASCQDAASARVCVDATVTGSPTATPTEVPVGPDKGVVLDATTTRTLIAAHDTLTVVVTALPSPLSAAEAPTGTGRDRRPGHDRALSPDTIGPCCA